MLKNEFEKLVGYEVSDSDYRVIECCYMAAGDGVNKEQFCEEWKKRFMNSEMFMKIADTLTDDRSKAMKESEKAQKRLENIVEKLCEYGLKWDDEYEEIVELKPWERIQTLDDALMATGMSLGDIDKLPVDIQAEMKLRVIVAAVNELTGDTLNEFPTFGKDEVRYEPWLCGYSKDDVDRMSEKEKRGLWLFGGLSSYGSLCGLAFATSYGGWSYSYSAFSARLVFKDRERALYCMNQFVELWGCYFFGREVKPEKYLK